MAVALRPPLRIAEPDPFGDVTLVPAMASGRSEAETARAMADALLADPAAGAQALGHLRLIFPHSPLTVRLAGLAALMRR